MKKTHGFQTEVAKLLDLLANSLYSNKEVFLRELISNASDAIDKLRFLSITDAKLLEDVPEFKITVKADRDAGTLEITDNGIGMTLEDADTHLGTIAKSGTEAFFKNLSGNDAKTSELIGQFGVGFYSAFIVADRVTVMSRAAGHPAKEGVLWTSDGHGTFESEMTEVPERGTKVILHLKDDAKDFLEAWNLRQAITKYSDHISVPVYLWEEKFDEKAPEDEEKKAPVFEFTQVNDAKALWTQNAKDITEEQYRNFYKHLSHDFDDPLTWSHNRVEGELEYTTLLYVPKNAPWDLFNRDQTKGLKLFVQRVFIMDQAEQFLPNYLRFIKGLVDTKDLPLNISRELLQESPVTTKLKKAVTKRVLTMIEKLAADNEKYTQFWSQFGRVMKEGPVEDYANRETIEKLLRFASTANETAEQNVSLADYVSRMKEGQKAIYYLIAPSFATASTSPYLEQLKKKGIEVLLLTDRIDEWLMGSLTAFDGKEFISVTEEDLKLGDLEDTVEDSETQKDEAKALIERFKAALGDTVTDVRTSKRLTETPAVVVNPKGASVTAQMRRMMQAMGQDLPETKYSLEINPEHPLIARAMKETDEAKFTQWAQFFYDQALFSEQGELSNPNDFVRRMNALLLG
ncbi:MAG TPA: molecular chaperone HtpG [Sutterella sp.]|nr:molecular chaperone HtpG [Sutterella sp.]